MLHEENAVHFFLGANTPQGFVSQFGQLNSGDLEWKTYIIKGGPGTGKSSMMKKIAQYAQTCCQHIELVPCSSDIHSLDAVLLHDYKIAFVDGTAPHERVPFPQKSNCNKTVNLWQFTCQTPFGRLI